MKKILEELLGDYPIKEFSKDWINTHNTTDESLRSAYSLLQSYGLTDSKIATHAVLLTMNPEAIDRNYQRLKQLGLTDSKIASHAELLGRDPEAIDRNYQGLKQLGLTDSRIASQAQLLGMNPKTIKKKYQYLIGLLREDYKARDSGRNILQKHANFLGMSLETTEANIQYLTKIGIDYLSIPLVLSTKPSTKRKKIAWMLRELMDYENLPQKERKRAISKTFEFIRKNPRTLIKSIKSLEKKKKSLSQMIQ